MRNQIDISPANLESREAIISLLQSAGLPVEDLPRQLQNFFTATDNGSLVGVIGLETYDRNGLLRSLVVKPEYRKMKVAAALVDEVEQLGRNLGLTNIYLLTETAKDYFAGKGYQQVAREQAPESLKQSTEFSHVCPSTATLMKKTISQGKKKLLFVCIENSNRSQMSQAFATIYGEGQIEAYSAGSKPSGKINPKAIEAMAELGYDLTQQHSKSLDEVKQYAPFDAVVTMGCGDACPWMPANKFVDWEIPDPKNMEKERFREVRDLIGEKVKDLVASLG